MGQALAFTDLIPIRAFVVNLDELRLYRRAEVGRAAKELDERCPGWAKRVDCDTLDLKSTTACILGQVYAKPRWWSRADRKTTPYQRGLRAMGWLTNDGSIPIFPTFNASVFACPTFAPAWKALIAERVGA